MSVDPSQIVQNQSTNIGAADRAASAGLEESRAGASQVASLPDSVSAQRGAEEATHHSMKQSTAELAEIADEVRRIRTMQTRETDQAGKPKVIKNI